MEEHIKRIEERIKELKDYIEFEDYEEDVLEECKKDIKALENLLKRYKELKEENIGLRHRCIHYMILLNSCFGSPKRVGRANQKPLTSFKNFLKEYEYKPQIKSIFFDEFIERNNNEDEIIK